VQCPLLRTRFFADYLSRNANPSSATTNGASANTHFMSVKRGPKRSENGDKLGYVPAILK